MTVARVRTKRLPMLPDRNGIRAGPARPIDPLTDGYKIGSNLVANNADCAGFADYSGL
jgi:hypothetical protein